MNRIIIKKIKKYKDLKDFCFNKEFCIVYAEEDTTNVLKSNKDQVRYFSTLYTLLIYGFVLERGIRKYYKVEFKIDSEEDFNSYYTLFLRVLRGIDQLLEKKNLLEALISLTKKVFINGNYISDTVCEERNGIITLNIFLNFKDRKKKFEVSSFRNTHRIKQFLKYNKELELFFELNK